MMCPGCYKINVEGYCTACRKEMFDGVKVSPILPFKAPALDTIANYQEKTKRLSISGVQLKYSLRLTGKVLELTDTGGQYIIKPIPPGSLLAMPEITPENEHLTMQLARQVFNIKTAANALIYFEDGTPAYITRRFDVKPDGAKYLQEDMAQLSGRSRQTVNQGEDFKYNGTYEEIGALIKQYVAAYTPTLERYFKLVLFNYLFSNGDAHLKNFSLIQTAMGDYTLTPAYDVMCTLLHVPTEADMALDLYNGDHQSTFYEKHGFFGRADFRTFADKLGLQPVRARRLITELLSKRNEVVALIEKSFLPRAIKKDYTQKYLERLARLGMTEQMISEVIDPEHPGVYTAAKQPVTLTFLDRSTKVGFFYRTPESEKLKLKNQYNFVEMRHAKAYKKKPGEELMTIVNGDELLEVAYM
ncbi:HipA domain-containing protein [Terrimonas rubra]|uniref:HipA domain-containing protein n=1 Tax=Terrimonas rubra TaxID=1035890 RepID=A0ABW6A9G1_9BACT